MTGQRPLWGSFTGYGLFQPRANSSSRIARLLAWSPRTIGASQTYQASTLHRTGPSWDVISGPRFHPPQGASLLQAEWLNERREGADHHVGPPSFFLLGVLNGTKRNIRSAVGPS